MPFGVPVAKEEVEYGNFGTSDNGKTWTIDWLHMNEAKFGQTSQRELTTAATSSIPNASKFVPPKESSKPSPHPLIRRGDPAVDALHLRWGPHWGGRVDPAKNYIESVDTTLVMPKTQSPQNARLEIWPSVFTTGQDLIQVVSISTDANGRKACNAKAGQWCSYASVYHVGATGQLTDGTSYAVDAGQIMNIKYEYDDHTGNTTQTVKLDGRLVDKFSTSSGKPYDYYLTVECQVWAHGPMDAHSYRYTTIRLNKADMSYRDAFQGTNMSHSDIETHDGGKTWYIDWIHVNESWFEKVLD
ncbi:hypothetical protein EJ08DRAFT_650161 [Tothia fuscella]|uniref:Uncharacterized protein n=1 Tax=Tothia fuscella TaxID=1048955 RepID=A0A9P4NQB5_9PEZI|nr:hypothetical protein EJ08DRAFT_650161 [Tothia fuscella]